MQKQINNDHTNVRTIINSTTLLSSAFLDMMLATSATWSATWYLLHRFHGCTRSPRPRLSAVCGRSPRSPWPPDERESSLLRHARCGNMSHAAEWRPCTATTWHIVAPRHGHATWRCDIHAAALQCTQSTGPIHQRPAPILELGAANDVHSLIEHESNKRC